MPPICVLCCFVVYLSTTSYLKLLSHLHKIWYVASAEERDRKFVKKKKKLSLPPQFEENTVQLMAIFFKKSSLLLGI